MNRRWRRRAHWLLHEDRELLYAALIEFVAVLLTVAAVVAVGAVVLTAAGRDSVAPTVLTSVAVAGGTWSMWVCRRHSRAVLARARERWAQDEIRLAEDVADVFDVPDEIVAAPRVTNSDVQKTFWNNELKPHLAMLGADLTEFLYREGVILPPATVELVPDETEGDFNDSAGN